MLPFTLEQHHRMYVLANKLSILYGQVRAYELAMQWRDISEAHKRAWLSMRDGNVEKVVVQHDIS